MWCSKNSSLMMALTVACAILMRSAPAEATEPLPLPEFEVTAVDGQKTTTSALSRQGRWLLISIQPQCISCEALLHLFKKGQYPALSQRLIVIVGGTVEETKGLAEKFPDLADVAWYADTGQHALSQLRLQGAPVILGIRHTLIEWSIAGVLSHPQDLRTVFTTWLQE